MSPWQHPVVSIRLLQLDMAKRADWVGQSGRRSKRITGQNGLFLNGSIGLRVKRVAG